MMTPFHIMQLALLRDENRAKEMLGLVRPRPGGPIQLYGETGGDGARVHGKSHGRRAAGSTSTPRSRKRWTVLPVLGR